jgi:hypothetical protein
MGHMPKLFEKGPTLGVVEESVRSPLSRAELLLRLRGWQGSDDRVGRLCDEVFAGVFNEVEAEHIRRDWFGVGGPTFFVGWEDSGALIEAGVAEGLVQAAEASLGLGSGESLEAFVADLAARSQVSVETAEKTLLGAGMGVGSGPVVQLGLRRCLPLELFWMCELPVFEVFVSWSASVVTVVLGTPSVDAELVVIPQRPSVLSRAKMGEDRGMVAVQVDPRAGSVMASLFDDRNFASMRDTH